MIVGVIADDLTGACGVAGDFARFGLTAGVWCADDAMPPLSEVDVLVLHTNSRVLNTVASAAVNARAASLVASFLPRIVIHKIDSLLRGPIGSDISAVMAALGERRAMVVAAVPREGRKTLDGVQWVGDSPLLTRDGGIERPLRIADCLLPSGMPANPIGIQVVRRGSKAVEEAISGAGDGLFVCDAITDDHVRDALLGALGAGIRVVASSYGVAYAVLSACAATAGPVLAVSGSVSSRAREQVALVRNRGSVATVLWGRESQAECRAHVVDLLCAGRDVLIHTVEVDAHSGSVPDSSVEGSLLRFISELAGHMIGRVSAFVATGGATAEALRSALGATRLSMLGAEALPCSPLAVLQNGPFAGVPFITKPGAFGSVSSMHELIDLAKIASLSRFRKVTPPSPSNADG